MTRIGNVSVLVAIQQQAIFVQSGFLEEYEYTSNPCLLGKAGGRRKSGRVIPVILS